MVLDTNALSALFAGNPQLAELLGDVPLLSVPSIALGEYRFGLCRSRQRETLEPLLDELVRVSRVLVVDERTAEVYAEVRDRLRSNGTPIPENDVWIAALCRQHSLPLASRDRHFDHVAGLRRSSW